MVRQSRVRDIWHKLRRWTEGQRRSSQSRMRIEVVVATIRIVTPAKSTEPCPVARTLVSSCSRPLSLAEAKRDAGPLLEAAAERVVRLFSVARGDR